jgi:1-acyl-sn-glycerol-3-phosphate acyltransferase
MLDRKKLFRSVVTIVQIVVYLLFALPIRFIYKAKRTLPENIDLLQKGVLIVANHQSKMDPFFILACIPLKTFMKILPVSFPVLDDFYYSPVYNPRLFPFLKMLGCFPVGTESHEKMRTMFYIRDLLHANQTVFIFPEGKISREEYDVDALQQGIEFFTNYAPQVVFVRIYGLNGIYHEDHIAERACKIVFGDVLPSPISFQAVEVRDYLRRL